MLLNSAKGVPKTYCLNFLLFSYFCPRMIFGRFAAQRKMFPDQQQNRLQRHGKKESYQVGKKGRLTNLIRLLARGPANFCYLDTIAASKYLSRGKQRKTKGRAFKLEMWCVSKHVKNVITKHNSIWYHSW